MNMDLKGNPVVSFLSASKTYKSMYHRFTFTHVWDDLVGNLPIVLENIVICGSTRNGNILCNWEKLGKLVIGNVMKLLSVEFGDHKLSSSSPVRI